MHIISQEGVPPFLPPFWHLTFPVRHINIQQTCEGKRQLTRRDNKGRLSVLPSRFSAARAFGASSARADAVRRNRDPMQAFKTPQSALRTQWLPHSGQAPRPPAARRPPRDRRTHPYAYGPLSRDNLIHEQPRQHTAARLRQQPERTRRITTYSATKQTISVPTCLMLADSDFENKASISYP
jgi:hypothetical protein